MGKSHGLPLDVPSALEQMVLTEAPNLGRFAVGFTKFLLDSISYYIET
jgi:hypothetical protein